MQACASETTVAPLNRNQLKQSRKLQQIPAFSELSDKAVGLVVDSMTLRSGVCRGEVMVKQNESMSALS